MNYVKVNADAFKKIQFEAGVVTKNFNPESPNLTEGDIIAVTSGGINILCQPSYVDLFEDVDNVPNGTKEGKRIDSWDCGISYTAIGMTEEQVADGLGASDVEDKTTTGGTLKKIVPRAELKDSDFDDAVWWVGDTIDGGFCAVCLKNALSDEGLNIQTTKKGKGNTSVSLKGHFSIHDIDTVPMEFYVFTPEA